MKIAMLIRDNAFTQRGGDSVVLENLKNELIALGHNVVVDLECKEDLSQFDMVHLFNFATAMKLQALVKHCVSNRIKFVVTTLYEDWPKYFSQMVIQEMLLSAYVKSGQPSKDWPAHENTALNAVSTGKQDNTYAALAAQILVSSGFEESVVLRRDYPDAGPIEICHFGSQTSSYSDGGELFRKEYGFDNFVLCVGRLEQRKNQLSLLKALEHSSETIVFAAGGFSYNDTYAERCRSFKRAGKNVFLERISSELLTSAFEAAAVHVLPSWYELPGLVNVDAAALGTPTVVTDWGTIRDYLGDSAYYCNPGLTEDIRETVELALKNGRGKWTKPDVSRFTWTNCARRMLEIYEKAIQLPLIERDLDKYYQDENQLNEAQRQNYQAVAKDNPSINQLVKLIR